MVDFQNIYVIQINKVKVFFCSTSKITVFSVQFSSVSPVWVLQFSHSVLSESLRPHAVQHCQASLSMTNSQSLLKLKSVESVMLPKLSSSYLILCHPFLLLPSIFPSIRVFSNESVLRQYFGESGQSIGASALASVLPVNIQDWLVWSPCNLRDSQESSPTPQFKSINSLALNFLYGPTLTSTHDYWKIIVLTRWTFVSKVMSLLFNMLSRFVMYIFFSPKEQESFNFMAAVTICSDFGAQEKKVCHWFHCFHIFCHEVMGPDDTILVSWMFSFKPAFSLSSFTFIKGSFVPLHFLP